MINSNVKVGATLLNNEKIFIGNKFLRELFFDLKKSEKKEHILNYFFKALNIFPENFIKYHENFNKKISKIIIHPGASIEKKKWGIENYFKLSKLLHSDTKNIEIFITGSESEKTENFNLEKLLLKSNIPTNNLTGKLDFISLFELIKSCDILISSDTFIQHLAALTTIKSITIFLGGCYHYHTYPYQLNKTVIYPDIKCYPCQYNRNCNKNLICRNYITPEMVYRVILGEKIKNSLETKVIDNLIRLK